MKLERTPAGGGPAGNRGIGNICPSILEISYKVEQMLVYAECEFGKEKTGRRK